MDENEQWYWWNEIKLNHSELRIEISILYLDDGILHQDLQHEHKYPHEIMHQLTYMQNGAVIVDM